MKRLIPFAFALLFATAAAAEVTGVWTASADARKAGRVYLSVARDNHYDQGMSRELAGLVGLTEAQMRSTVQQPVQFELRSEAGTAIFGGTFRNGHGAGHFTFNGDRAYIDKLRALGLAFDLYPKTADDETKLLTLASHDLSTSYIKSMREAGYDESLKTYLSMRIHGATPEFVRELRALGFRDIPARELVSLRIHGVTPDYIREMRAGGDDPTLKDLVSSRIHGATPEFAAEMGRLGYPDLTRKELVAFRIHGVTADFIKDLRGLGYERIAAKDLTAMRIHGVTPDYIRELGAAGYRDVPVRKLIAMRIHGLDVNTIEKLNAVR